MTPRSNLVDLAGALGVLSREIESDDGIANAVCAEAAQRLLECTKSCLGAWETIETAPLEDGEHVLLDGSGANFDCCSFVGFWREHRAEWVSFPGAEVVTPTHWMPLPTCPDGEGPALSKPLDAVHCPGCAEALPADNTGICPHCGYADENGRLLSFREVLAEPSYPAPDATTYDDVCPGFLRALAAAAVAEHIKGQ